jgi:hypothetical protein
MSETTSDAQNRRKICEDAVHAERRGQQEASLRQMRTQNTGVVLLRSITGLINV